jgi:hypothetical protein
MGVRTCYLIYGTQELFGRPSRRAEGVDYGTAVWGIWMPGLMQLFTVTSPKPRRNQTG